MMNEEKNQLETLSLAYKTLEMNYREKCVENDKLKSENAVLRERLEKAVLGKCIYYINSVWNDATMTRKEEVCQGTVDYVCDNFVEVAGLVLKWDEIYFTREAVKASLAEERKINDENKTRTD